VESDRRYYNTNPMCEPQLGKRGLYRALGGLADVARAEMALLWILNLSDGTHSLLDIAARSGLDFWTIRDAAALLQRHALLSTEGSS
jgi:aminopeptidase-like protein